MSTINITINDLSTMNTSALGKLVKQMRRDEYLKIMAALPVGRENAMTADQIAAITGTTPDMVSIIVSRRGKVNSCKVSARDAALSAKMHWAYEFKNRRWAEIDENGEPTGAIRTETKKICVYWVERKITLDDLL